MKVGVNILNFGPGAGAPALLRWARVAEGLGYHSLMMSDHIAITPSVRQRYPEPFFDPFATLTWLAGQTSRIGLGTTVIVLPYRHPVHMARLVANLDEFSGGRFTLGVGVGNAEDEFRVLGKPHNRRGAVGDEYLQAMIALWQGETSVSFHGKFADFEDISPIRTQQQPHPPIWVGGNSPAALRRAVLYGDAWHPILWRSTTIDAVANGPLVELRQIATQAGRPVPAFCPRIRLEITQSPVEGEREPGKGSLEQVRGDLAKLQELGAEHVTLDWYTGDLEQTRNHEHGWYMLSLLADQVFDLAGERLK